MKKQIGIYCRTINENFFINNEKVYIKKELAGDILQAYWTTKNILNVLKELNLNDVEILAYDPNLKLNHFFGFYIHLFYNFNNYAYLYKGKHVGITANYTNFFLSKFITSNSLLNRFLSFFILKLNKNFINLVSNIISNYYFNRDFLKFTNGFLLALESNYIQYFIFNSLREQNLFLNLFRKNRNIYNLLNQINKYIIYNCLDFQEIEDILNNTSLNNSLNKDLIFNLILKVKNLSKNKLLFIGRFDRIKNILNLIKVFDKEKIYKDFVLIILGRPVSYDLNYYEILKSISKSNQNIYLINIDEIGNFYHDKRYITLKLIELSDIVILPSFEETFSLTALEALYFNKKLIITQNSPYYELYPELINNFVFPINPLNFSLKKILLKIYLNKENKNIKSEIISKFDCKKISKQYLDIFLKYYK
jgi:glycosyltransferase involved in cell wall biosynthesis